MKRWVGWLAVLALAMVSLSGCAGQQVPHVSWPGLTVADGKVYAAATTHILALDAQDGTLLWQFPEEEKSKLGPFYATPTLVADEGLLIVAGFGDKTVYALRVDGEKPTIAWQFPQTGSGNGGAKGQYVGAGTVAEGLFLIGNGDGHLYALKVKDGTLAWSFATGDRVWTQPLVEDGVVYIGSLDHFLYALKLQDGTLLWKTRLNGAVATAPVWIGEHLWIGDFGHRISEIDPRNGEVLWSYQGESWFWAHFAVRGEVLYAADVKGTVYALNTRTHELLWKTPGVVRTVRGALLLDEEGKRLFVEDYELGEVRALDLLTGQLAAWRIRPQDPGRLPGDPVLAEGRLYTMPIMVKASVQAFELTNGTLVWQYPDVPSGQ